MSSMFTSVQNLDDPFVDQPCTPSPALERIRHHQEQLEQSAKSPRSASKTRFTAEDIEKINATRRSRRKQLVCFLKNRTHLRQLDKVLYDAGIDNLNADDRDYLIQQGPWEIVELPDGEQVLESRRDEFKSAMTELDEETVAIGLKCRESLSAHASLKAIHDRLQGDDKVPKRGNDVFQTCKFNMHSYVDMMRDMFASFCRVVDDAGNNEKPGEHMDADTSSAHASDPELHDDRDRVDDPKSSAPATATTSPAHLEQSTIIARTSTTSLNSEWLELDSPYPKETSRAVQTLPSNNMDAEANAKKTKQALPSLELLNKTESQPGQQDDPADEDLVFVGGVGQD
ncbi:hypothetical protein HDK77DRAFT_500558 [Phyllosticta capitalensis]